MLLYCYLHYNHDPRRHTTATSISKSAMSSIHCRFLMYTSSKNRDVDDDDDDDMNDYVYNNNVKTE